MSRQADGLVAILRPGHEAFTELSESIIGQFPAMERGTIYTNFQTELFDFLATTYVGRARVPVSRVWHYQNSLTVTISVWQGVDQGSVEPYSLR